MIKVTKNIEYYFELLLIYSNLNQVSKDKIFISVLKNEHRILNKKNKLERKLSRMIISYKTNKNIFLLKKKLERLLEKNGYTCKNRNIDYKNFIAIRDEAKKIYYNVSNEKIVGIAMALFLDKNNLLPLIWYAFDKSLFMEYINRNQIINIILLSICYLYRLVEINIDTKYLGEKIGNGAYCKVLKCNNKLYKVPLNYAAFFYENINEWEMYKKLLNTKLNNYIPKYFKYHIETGIIEKEYIYGNTGEQILIKKGKLSEEEKKSLEKIYNIISEVYIEKNILLDIHPNNFVLNEINKQWYLIDLGENQYIGADYYILNNFEKYYKKSWLEREMRKRKYPIRSVLL